MEGIPRPWALFSAALEGLVLPDNFYPRVEAYLEALSEINRSLNLISFSKKEDLYGHVAVSYTHLDVYKRQLLSYPAIPFSRFQGEPNDLLKGNIPTRLMNRRFWPGVD